MVRAPSIDQNGMKKGAWSQEEDNKLTAYVQRYGHWNWRQLPKFAGLNRCGKSCRLRWLNYLKPGIRRGNYTPQEEDLILELYRKHGSKWSQIAAQLPGRVDNDIKNHWHSHLRRKMKLSSKSTDEVDLDYNQDSDSFSVSTFNSQKKRRKDQDQMKNNFNDNEASSLSSDSMVLLQDSAAPNLHHLHLQLPAFPEDEIMRPFTSDLNEVNMDYWLHDLDDVNMNSWLNELMQIDYDD